MTLQITYRPKSFKTFSGNEDVLASLTEILKRKNPPAAFLFTGLGGTGKTTLGRIVAKMLGCKKADFQELNSADDRGIDGIRKIISNMKYTALGGGKKVILLDEGHCFCSDTLISTPNGQKRIDSIKVNDSVFNLNGTDIVEKVFINKVLLNNVARINKTDGTHTFCSKDHEYYIDENWIEAKDLTNTLLVKYSQYMTNINSHKEVQDATQSNLQILQKVFLLPEKNRNLLLQQLFCILQRIIKRKTNKTTNKMQTMPKQIYPKLCKSEVLFQKLFWDICKKLCKEYSPFRGNKEKNKRSTSCIRQNKTWQTNGKKFFTKNEEKQPNEYAWNKRENDSNSKNKRNSILLDWKTWWKWSIDRTTEIINGCIRVETRSHYKNSGSFAYATTNGMVQKKECSYELQSGLRKQKTENSNRDRWENTQLTTKTKTGQKEGIFSEMERVESVEIYKQGCNDESFSSVIGDKERNQGYVEFYDLQIKENYSYIANNNMVHNCLTKPSQEALLKALEEPPEYVHWIICTTNPEALKQTFKRRCHAYELESLKNSDLHKLIERVLKQEKRDKAISMTVRDKIIELSDGSAGQALKLLDQIIDMDDTDRAISTLQSAGTSESEVIEICRTLCNYNMPTKTKWSKIKKMLKEYKGDGESARRPILGYLNSVLLNNGGDEIFFMMQPFRKNFFDDGKAGLACACYEAIHGEE